MRKLLILIGCFICNVYSFGQTERDFLTTDTLPSVWSDYPMGILGKNVHSKTNSALPIPIHAFATLTSKSSFMPKVIVGNQLYPWNHRFMGNPNFPFASDYLYEGQLWRFRTTSSHITYPFWGSAAYAQFLYRHRLTEHLGFSAGVFFGKYSILQQEDEEGNRWLLNDSPMIHKLFNDFGGISGMEYNLIDQWSLLFNVRYSLMERSNKIVPSITPMFPHNNMEMKLQFVPVRNVKIKVDMREICIIRSDSLDFMDAPLVISREFS